MREVYSVKGPLRVKNISSEQNPIFKRFLKLKEARGIKKFEMALLSGPKYVKEALEEFPEQCLGVITPSLELLEPLPLGPNLPVYLLRSELFRALDIHNTKKPILAIKAPSADPWVEDGQESKYTFPESFGLLAGLEGPGIPDGHSEEPDFYPFQLDGGLNH